MIGETLKHNRIYSILFHRDREIKGTVVYLTDLLR